MRSNSMPLLRGISRVVVVVLRKQPLRLLNQHDLLPPALLNPPPFANDRYQVKRFLGEGGRNNKFDTVDGRRLPNHFGLNRRLFGGRVFYRGLRLGRWFLCGRDSDRGVRLSHRLLGGGGLDWGLCWSRRLLCEGISGGDHRGLSGRSRPRPLPSWAACPRAFCTTIRSWRWPGYWGMVVVSGPGRLPSCSPTTCSRTGFGRPGKGNGKGKVEGMVGYVRRNFLVPVPSFQSFEALNAHLEQRCLERMDAQLRGHTETIGPAHGAGPGVPSFSCPPCPMTPATSRPAGSVPCPWSRLRG